MLRALIATFVAFTSSFAFAIPEFLVLENGQLILTSEDPNELLTNCQQLQDYFAYHAARNSLPFSSQPCAQPQRLGRVTNYTLPFDIAEPASILKRDLESRQLFFIPLPFVPRDFYERIYRKPQDGVCYNTALVESGVLSESDRSLFVNHIDYFLGMNGLSLTRFDAKKITLRLGPRSDSPLVKFRAAWEINSKNRLQRKTEITQTIRQHFSPGSVLCIDAQPLQKLSHWHETLKEMEQEVPDKTIETNIDEAPHDFYAEYQGGHCLVFLTPDLISESNLLLSKRLISWSRAYDFYAELMESLNIPEGSATFFYFQIDQEKALEGSWIQKELKKSKRYSLLLDLARRHRELYESLRWKACDGTSDIDLYNPSCKKTNPQAVKALRSFWKKVGNPILNRPEFKTFRKNEESPCEGFVGLDLQACYMYSNMIERRDSLKRSSE